MAQKADSNLQKQKGTPSFWKIWIKVFAGLLIFFLAGNSYLLPWPRFLHLPANILTVAASFFVLVAFGTIFGFIGYMVYAFVNINKKTKLLKGINYALACLVFFVLFSALFILSLNIRSSAFARAANNGEPIISALAKYNKNNGKYPEKLSELTPKYLPDTPWTELIGYPDFYYYKNVDWRKDADGNQPSYELGIQCGTAILDFDWFFYWPSEKYPDNIEGNGIERIGKWAYVHE